MVVAVNCDPAEGGTIVTVVAEGLAAGEYIGTFDPATGVDLTLTVDAPGRGDARRAEMTLDAAEYTVTFADIERRRVHRQRLLTAAASAPARSPRGTTSTPLEAEPAGHRAPARRRVPRRRRASSMPGSPYALCTSSRPVARSAFRSTRATSSSPSRNGST